MTDIEQARRDVQRARAILQKAINGQPLKMSIPVDQQDEDLILSRVIDLAECALNGIDLRGVFDSHWSDADPRGYHPGRRENCERCKA